MNLVDHLMIFFNSSQNELFGILNLSSGCTAL